jgi:hypothetical protein
MWNGAQVLFDTAATGPRHDVHLLVRLMNPVTHSSVAATVQRRRSLSQPENPNGATGSRER